MAEEAGFAKVHLEYRVDIEPQEPQRWDAFVGIAPNPLAPSLGEAMAEVLTPDEAAQFAAHLRPLVEGGQVVNRWALAYLWAVKG